MPLPFAASEVLPAAGVDAGAFLIVVFASALAAVLVGLLGPRVAIPVVVVELVFGIVIGPSVLGLVEPDRFIEFFAGLGLGMLFFFAGYEIDLVEIRGEPLRLAVAGWCLSLVVAYAVGGLLAWAGVIVSLLFTGSAMATTAIGTLIPIVGDAGQLKTRFGTYLLGAGAIGEFGPILLVTVFLSAGNPIGSAILLLSFITVAVITALLAIRSVSGGWSLLERRSTRAASWR